MAVAFGKSGSISAELLLVFSYPIQSFAFFLCYSVYHSFQRAHEEHFAQSREKDALNKGKGNTDGRNIEKHSLCDVLCCIIQGAGFNWRATHSVGCGNCQP